MAMQRVRVGQRFTWEPVMLDACDPRLAWLAKGTELRVINLRGCPPANTMGHCYVETVAEKEFVGLVCCNSLKRRS
jgi:hypothetical protein